MKRYSADILSEITGLSLIGATLDVFVSGTETRITLYAQDDDTGATVAQPVANGTSFYVPDGRYDLRARVAGRSRLIPAVDMFDGVEQNRRLEAIENGEPAAPGSLRADLKAPDGSTLIDFQHQTASISRPVSEKLRETVSVLDFGAVADWNPTTQTGTDSTVAFQAALDFAANIGGAEVLVPGSGNFKISKGLAIRNRTTLRGCASIQGGPGMIYCYGDAFLDTGTSGYPLFNIRNVAACAGRRQVTNFLSRATPGVWSYGVCEDNYFVNFAEFNAVVLGVKFFKNNFQNLGRAVIGGADMLFIGNYANLDEMNTTTKEVFWQFQAAGATDFSHNYFTCFRSATDDPIVLDINLCDKFRIGFNQLDGGKACSIRLSSASHGIEVINNRLASLSSFSQHGRVPIILNQDISDVVIRDNFCANLEAGAPFITYNGGIYRVQVVDNILRDSKNDASTHDYSANEPGDGSKIHMTGPGIPKLYSLGDGGKFRSVHFARLWTNNPAVSTANPRINYVDMGGVTAGDVIRCFRSDLTRRWIIYDQSNSVVIYDSDKAVRQGFSLYSLADGTLSSDAA